MQAIRGFPLKRGGCHEEQNGSVQEREAIWEGDQTGKLYADRVRGSGAASKKSASSKQGESET